MGIAKIVAYTPYVKGIVGQEFRLTLLQRLKILFCKKLEVRLMSDDFKRRKDGTNARYKKEI